MIFVESVFGSRIFYLCARVYSGKDARLNII